MTLKIIDARGRSCPEPLLLTKKALGKAPRILQVMVDNTTARDNVQRFAKNLGYRVEIIPDGEGFILKIAW